MANLGEILKAMRQAAGLSQSQLARLAGIKTQQVSHMETGVRGIGPKSRIRLAKAFGLKIEEFNRILTGRGEKSIVRLWLKLHTLSKKDVRKILPILLQILEIYELVREEQIPQDLYESLRLQIVTILTKARNLTKIPS